MSVQVRRRREAASFLASFVGAQGELLVDTTNSRVQVHDGATPGGWPAAKLAEVVTNTYVGVADSNYAPLATDRTVAFTAITQPRTVALPAAAAYPRGTRLAILDASGACSAASTITVTPNGSDTIEGTTSLLMTTGYAVTALQSNGTNGWTVVDRVPAKGPTTTVLTAASGTYAPPPGATWLFVRMVGAGGGGGGSGTTNTAGGAGGNTTFGPTLVAYGGGGALGQGGAGKSQQPTSGDLNAQGAASTDGITGLAGMSFTGGPGGVSAFGGAAVSRAPNASSTNSAGGAVANSGSGGAGAGCFSASQSTSSGGGGGAGSYLEKTIVAPSGSYPYAVGQGGAAGAAGQNGYAASAGATGVIIVQEHYD